MTGRKKAEKRNFFTPKVMDHVELSNLGEKSPNCFVIVLAEANCTSPAEEHRDIRAREMGKKQPGRGAGMLNCICCALQQLKVRKKLLFLALRN